MKGRQRGKAFQQLEIAKWVGSLASDGGEGAANSKLDTLLPIQSTIDQKHGI